MSQIKSKTGTRETADADDGDNVGYLMQQWTEYWHRGAVFVVIVKVKEMHGIVNIAVAVAVAVEVAVV